MIRFREGTHGGARALRRVAIVALFASIPACAVAVDDSSRESTATSAEALTTPVPTVDGLPGSYTSTTFVDPMIAMTIGPMAQAAGSYSRTVCSLTCGVETGTYHAIPNNPAIGIAMISFQSSSGKVSSYEIQGVQSDATGAFTLIQLRAIVSQGTAPSFQMRRTGGAPPPPIDAGTIDAALPTFDASLPTFDASLPTWDASLPKWDGGWRWP